MLGILSSARWRTGATPRSMLGAALCSLVALGNSCTQKSESEPVYLARVALLDPETCRDCHRDHYREWAGSMHAYAAFDPLFLAMNRRGQEETGGALGDFCVKCHAPMAVNEGATIDGLNLEDLPAYLQGVTCYACHNVSAVEGLHDNQLRLANDLTMRGGIEDPVANGVHASTGSDLFASARVESATLCGSCHDLVLPSPPAPRALFLERTFSQWQASIFSPPQAADDTAALSCNGCHMLPTPGVPIATISGRELPRRSRHAHTFAAVDVALTPFPDTGDAALDQESSDVQRLDLERLLDSTLRVEVCVQVGFTGRSAITVTLDNATAGHNFPSGAAQDRRAFVEVKAFASSAALPFYTSGVIGEDANGTDGTDPDLWLLRDRIANEREEPVQQFWEAARLTEETLPVATSLDPLSPGFLAGHAVRRYPRQGELEQVPERVTLRVLLQPIGRDVATDLVDTGHLDERYARAIPTHVLLPNRHLASASSAPPELRVLGDVTFEWGSATRNHGNFRRTRQTTALGTEECLGMPSRPLPR